MIEWRGKREGVIQRRSVRDSGSGIGVRFYRDRKREGRIRE